VLAKRPLEHVIFFETEVAEDIEHGIALDRLEQNGRELAEQRPGAYDAYLQAVRADDLATIIYTSGTTGEPKGVMHSHAGLVFSVESIAEYLGLTRDDRILSVLPMAFTYGLSHLLLAARLGATLSLERSFTFPAKTLARLRDEEATVFPAVPTVYATILAMSEDTTYPSVRCLTNAAAGLPPALHEGIRRVFPNAALYRMYGQTECIRVCYLDPDLIDEKPTSIGKAIPGTEAFVVGDDGRLVEPGEVGVLHVRGPHLMMGYWRAPDLTLEKLHEGPYPGARCPRTTTSPSTRTAISTSSTAATTSSRRAARRSARSRSRTCCTTSKACARRL
jgi:acyl-CoA synthetase (AMP-forming)/AMP-acid ligase II